MNAFTPLFFVRPSVLLIAFAWSLGAGATAVWVAVAVLLWAECAWTTRRTLLAYDIRFPYLACGLAGLGAVAAAPVRLVAGLVTLWVWGTLVPVAMVNRDRFRAMRAARRAAIVEQVIEEAETMTLWARGLAALKVLRGAQVAPADPTKAEAVEGRVLKFSRRPA